MGSPHRTFGEDEVGEVQDIPQGEGGDQGDPLMPLLFSLALHPSLRSAADHLRDGEKIFAFLDDVHLVCTPDRVLEVFRIIENALWTYSKISVHCGKTQLWNRSGVTPTGSEELTRAAREEHPQAVVWRGDQSLPVEQQGVTVLGSPVGHDEFIRVKLMKKVTEHQTLLERIPLVSDVQSAWLLLLCCAATRANYWLRTVRPDLTLQFATAHDHDVLVCLGRILEVPVRSFESDETVSLPLSKGGLGLRSAVRSRVAAHWASWADCPAHGTEEAPASCTHHVAGGSMAGRQTISLNARECATSLAEAGCELPTWLDLVDGVRPPIPMDMGDPFQPRQGWQHFVSDTVEERHLHQTLRTLLPPQRALVRSQGGPLSARPFVCCPTSRLTKFQPQSFRILLLRRLHLPLPLSSRSCQCGRLLDCLGHHRSACAVAGVLGRRGFAVESAIASICREGGARVSTNVFRARFGSRSVQPPRWPSSGSCGRRIVAVWRGSVGNRHDSRFRFASRRHSDQRCC